MKTTIPALLLALTDPTTPEDLPAFLSWYENVQVPAFLTKLPGTKRVIRYRASKVRPAPALPATQEYLAVYDLEFEKQEDLAVYVDRQIQAKENSEVGYGSPGGWALNRRTSRGAYYDQVGGRLGVPDCVPDLVVLVFTDPSNVETEQEFSRWYAEKSNESLPDIAGIQASTSYRMADLDKSKLNAPLLSWVVPTRHLKVYEFKANDQSDLTRILNQMSSLIGKWPSFISKPGTCMQGYERIGEAKTLA